MRLNQALENYRLLAENTLLSRAEKAADKLAKQLRWPNNPPFWLHSIGVSRDSRGGAGVMVIVSPGFVSNIPKQIDGVQVTTTKR